jgi:hypothetical protein
VKGNDMEKTKTHYPSRRKLLTDVDPAVLLGAV